MNDIENKFYVYAYLDPRKPGEYIYGNYSFDYEPFYIGKGCGSRMSRHLWETEKNNSNNYKTNIIHKIKKLNLLPIIIIYKDNLTNEESII